MGTITISNTKCIKCKKCNFECPEGILSTSADCTVIDKTKLCLLCGHCISICPTNAISLIDNKSQIFKLFDFEKDILPQQSLLLSKRSVRCFSPKEIDKSEISNILKYAEQAPSAHNFRNRNYIVITNSVTIKNIVSRIIFEYKKFLLFLNPFMIFIISLFNKSQSIELKSLVKSFKYVVNEYKTGNDVVFHNSKCIICIAAPTYSGFSRDDCIASQHYMMLYAKTIKVESFIVGFAQYVHKSLEKILKTKKQYSIYAISAFGYSDSVFKKGIEFPVKSVEWN